MVKIEKLSETCIAKINNNMISEGQLFTSDEFNSMKVESGSVTVSIDEKDLITVDAIQLPDPDPNPDTVILTLSEELENMDKVLHTKKTDSLLHPAVKVAAKPIKTVK